MTDDFDYTTADLWPRSPDRPGLRSSMCPRKQCRGRVPHSQLVHWFGWMRR